jgi:DNA polymerase-3 subunit gamma/tau
MLLKGIPEVQASNRPVSAAEMVLIRLAHAADLPTLDEALKSLEDDSTRPTPVPGGAAPSGNGATAIAQSRVQSSGSGPAMRLVEASPEPQAALVPAPRPEPAVEAQPAVSIRSLADIATLADQHRDMTFKVLLKRCVRPVRFEAGRIDVALTEDAPRTLLNDLTSKLRAWTGRAWLVSLSKEAGGHTLAEAESARRENAILDARNDPAVAAILAKFPGAKIIDVRIPQTAEDGGDETDDLPADPPVDDEE